MGASRSVWRYDVPLGAPTTLTIPAGRFPAPTTILHVGKSRSGSARDGVSFWAEVNPSPGPADERTFILHGTGHPVLFGERYIGTVVYEGDGLVWHLYEANP